MIYLENLIYLIPILLIGVYGFAPYYILQYFKEPFKFLKYYIIIFQFIILYFQLISLDYLGDNLIPLYQATLLNPIKFWYVILYTLFNIVLFILYLHPYGKRKKYADIAGVIASITMLLSWGIIFGWMGQDEIGDMIYFSIFTIRLMGPLSILLPQMTWTYIFGNHSSPYKTMLFTKLEKKHDLDKLIPVIKNKANEKIENWKIKDLDDTKKSEILFFLEPEKRTSIIHTNQCKEFLFQTDNGENLRNWIGPLNSYEEAFETGSKLDGKSYPKICGKCTPWKYSKNGDSSKTVLVVKETSIEKVFACIQAWLTGINPSVEKIEPTYIKGITQRRTSYGAEIYREDTTFNLKPSGEDTVVEIELSINYGVETPYGVSINQSTKRVQKIKDDLREFLKESLKEYSKEIRYTVSDAFRNLQKTRPLLAKVADDLDNEPTSRGLNIIILGISITMLILFFGASFFFDLSIISENIIEVILTYGVATALIFWIYISDRTEKEPIFFVFLMFCWGIFSGVIAATINGLLESTLHLPSTLVAPFVEETIKALGLYVFLTHPRTRNEFNSPLDGVIYGFSVGVGFYAMENFFYYLNYDLGTLIIRILLCWGHGLWVAIVGLWIAINRHYRGYNTPKDLVPGLSVAVTLHLIWNMSSYLGEFGGQIIFYLALFQFGYLRKIIMEAKRDEQYAGPDKKVFGKLDMEGADKSSYSKILLVIVLVASLGSVVSYGAGYLTVGSEKWITYEIYGFSFDYPERLWNELEGLFEGEEPSESGGRIIFGNYRGQTREYLEVMYGSYSKLTFWRSRYYNELLAGEKEFGEEVEFIINGHKGLYRQFNLTRDGDSFTCVTSGWSCQNTWSCYIVRYHTEGDDAFESWKRVIDSFNCHEIH